MKHSYHFALKIQEGTKRCNIHLRIKLHIVKSVTCPFNNYITQRRHIINPPEGTRLFDFNKYQTVMVVMAPTPKHFHKLLIFWLSKLNVHFLSPHISRAFCISLGSSCFIRWRLDVGVICTLCVANLSNGDWQKRFHNFFWRQLSALRKNNLCQIMMNEISNLNTIRY